MWWQGMWCRARGVWRERGCVEIKGGGGRKQGSLAAYAKPQTPASSRAAGHHAPQVNFVLKVWALRESVSEMVFGKQALDLDLWTFYMLTYGLSLAAYLTSVFIPSVWMMLSLVGSTACVTFSYVFPGLLMSAGGATCRGRTAGKAVIAMAAVMAGVAVANTLSGHADL